MGVDEKLDAYGEDSVHLGAFTREEVHQRGLWHAVFHCLVVALRDETQPVAVLQLRHRSKLAFPELLDISAAGHILAGETPEQGIRELHEELGIDLRYSDLTPLGVRRLVDQSGEGINRELVHVHLARDDRPLSEYRPDTTEVSGLFDANLRDLVRLMAGSLDEMSITGLEWPAGNKSQPRTRTISVFDLVPDTDNYLLELLTRAQRFIPPPAKA